MSQNVEPQHPPHKKQGDDTEDNVCHPLAGGFWFSKVKHWAILASRSAADFSGMALPAPKNSLSTNPRCHLNYGAPLRISEILRAYFTRLILTTAILSG